MWLTQVVPGLSRRESRSAVSGSVAATARHMSGPSDFDTERTSA